MQDATSITSTIKISVIVPVYNEECNIKPFLNRLEPALEKYNLSYEILFCLDPSTDNTEKVIRDEMIRNNHIQLIIFSRRFGQPAATMAGITHCKGETAVVIDVDLQDQPELIVTMHKKLLEGFDVVYAKRRRRESETRTKKILSYLGYQIINKLSDVSIPTNTGDFRIMTRRVIDELIKLNETHGFLRGLVAYVGFKQSFIEYDRDKRYLGKGNYNRFTGSLKIGLNGIIGFSSRPLQMMSISGAAIAGLSFLLGAWYFIQKIIGINLSPGLSTTILAITFFSGVQLLCLGLIGEYIGRIYDEVKRRPMFIIDRIIKHEPISSDNKTSSSMMAECNQG